MIRTFLIIETLDGLGFYLLPSALCPLPSAIEEIYRIDCWRHVIHVVGKGVSRFVSYADIPPILGVEPPKPEDFVCWRKRWRKNKYKAPNFWAEFYTQKFKLALSLLEMYRWGQLVGVVKFAFSEAAVESLRNVYLLWGFGGAIRPTP